MESTELWAKGCMAEVVLDGLQAEVRKLRTGRPVYSPEVTALFQHAYRHASALSAALHKLEDLIPK